MKEDGLRDSRVDDVALHSGGQVLETSSTKLVKAVEVLKRYQVLYLSVSLHLTANVWFSVKKKKNLKKRVVKW